MLCYTEYTFWLFFLDASEDPTLGLPAGGQGPVPPGAAGSHSSHGGHPHVLHPTGERHAHPAYPVYADRRLRQRGQRSGQ